MTTRDNVRDAWLRMSPRERLLIGLGAIIVFGVVGFALVWEPMTRDLAALQTGVSEAEQRTRAARHTADQIAGLVRETRAPRTTDVRAAAERVIGAAGLRGDLTSIAVGDGRVRVTFAAIDFAALAGVLEALGREEQLFVAEALVAALVTPGSVRAEIALARPASP